MRTSGVARRTLLTRPGEDVAVEGVAIGLDVSDDGSAGFGLRGFELFERCSHHAAVDDFAGRLELLGGIVPVDSAAGCCVIGGSV